MKIVAFETSTSAGSIALLDDGSVVGEVMAQLRANHSDVLLPMLDGLLARAGVTLEQIDQLAVGLGPGSFTGVRIGLATAKGLRIATGRPLIGVGSLDALTAAAVGARGLVAAILDARRDELFAMLSRVDATGRTVVLPPWVGRVDAVGAAIRAAAGEAEVLAIGDLGPALWERVQKSAGGDGLRVLPGVAGMPLARFVAHEVLAGRGVPDDDGLEPLYVRPSDAKLPATAQQQAQTAAAGTSGPGGDG